MKIQTYVWTYKMGIDLPAEIHKVRGKFDTRRDNLLCQALFIYGDSAIPFGDSAALACLRMPFFHSL